MFNEIVDESYENIVPKIQKINQLNWDGINCNYNYLDDILIVLSHNPSIFYL